MIVEDTLGQKLFWIVAPLRPLVDFLFFRHARSIVRRILATDPNAIIHYLCPVSPILPRFPVSGATNVLGPLTGNIYYPPAFRGKEPMKLRFGRLFHYMAQRAAGTVFGDKRRFHRILISGGERTRRSLNWAGASDARMEDVVDSGISIAFDRHPIIHHDGVNDCFMTSGRLVPHKGVHLSIEALQYVTRPIRFDIYGDGAYRDALERLAVRLGVADKVRFLGWLESHDALIERMADYRGYLVPSLAEANGIVIQEAMMAGLPVICLKWGGPAMLAEETSAMMIEPGSQETVVRAIAAAMDSLATDPARANALVERAREIAEHRFRWKNVADEWQAAYGLGKRSAGPEQAPINILLMTATITPDNSPELARTDPSLRLEDYQQALAFYLGQLRGRNGHGVLDAIIFGENSDSDVSSLVALAEAHGATDRVEFIANYGHHSYPGRDRSVGESRLLDHAMASSQLIAAAGARAVIWKITGRYRVRNLSRIIGRAPRQFDLYCDLRNRPTAWLDLRFMAWTRAGYDRLLRDIAERLGTDPKESAMHTYVTELDDRNVVPRYRIEPLVDGVRGWDNRPYAKGGALAKFWLRAAARRVVPGLWI